ncbi:cobalt permease [Clostridium polyendosporum]|uniref:Cobalt permease n=1 Tax=Clostridium polyendosporum TaxID=69208 RepID=A0A919VDK0_9CLOT|nr:energy-coupling factor transporter transmembrane component T [Clostridium polyendosporum]GIM28094.1 cobalt permease [Clostridium polyendosporum]
MDWLFKQDDYVPKEDKDAFVDKSIFSLLGVLSSIKRSSRRFPSRIHSINPALKLISSLLIIILISISKSYKFTLVIYSYLFVMFALLNKEEIKKILCISLVIPIFTLIALIPSIIAGNVYNSLIIVMRILSAVLVTNILSFTTKWNDIVGALKLLYIPDIFILVMEITLRYIYILGEFSLDMLYALKLRSIGKNEDKYTSVSEMIGTLFLKSKDLGDELYLAMECRGFQGEYVHLTKFKLNLVDYIYGLFIIVLVLAFIIFNRM